MKKVLSLALSLIMLFTFIPVTNVFADATSQTYIFSKADMLTDLSGYNVHAGMSENLLIKKVFAGVGDKFAIGCAPFYSPYANSTMSAGWMTAMDMNKFKGEGYTWKNPWTDQIQNTLIYNGVEYDMVVRSGKDEGSAIDLSGWSKADVSLEENYYDKVSVLANGYDDADAEKEFKAVLTYADGTTELVSAGKIYQAFYLNAADVPAEASEKGFYVESAYMEGATNAEIEGTAVDTPWRSYVYAYNFKANENKKLKNITFLSGNLVYDESAGIRKYQDGDTRTPVMNVFAVTAVTTQDIMDAGNAVENEAENAKKLAEFNTYLDSITIPFADVNTAVTKISEMNKKIAALTSESVSIDAVTQAKIDAINSAYNSIMPIFSKADMLTDLSGYNVHAGMSENLLIKKVFAGVGDKFAIGCAPFYSPYANSTMSAGWMTAMDMNKFKGEGYTWKNPWTDQIQNTLIYNGVEYDMVVRSGKDEGSAIDLSGWSKADVSLEENYYDKVSVLANGYDDADAEKEFKAVLTYADGTTELVSAGKIYQAFYLNAADVPAEASEKGFYVESAYMEGATNAEIEGTAVDTPWRSYVYAYNFKANENKKLKNITFLSGNLVYDESAGIRKYQDGDTRTPVMNVFAVTAVTTNEIIDNARGNDTVYVPVNISELPDFTRKSFIKPSETASFFYDSIYAEPSLIDIDKFKADSDITWKDEWSEGQIRNTMIHNGVEYEMVVQSAVDGASALEVSKETKINIENGFYDKLSFIAVNGTDLFGSTGKKPLGAVVTYSDGTEEYVTSQNIYHGRHDSQAQNGAIKSEDQRGFNVVNAAMKDFGYYAVKDDPTSWTSAPSMWWTAGEYEPNDYIKTYSTAYETQEFVEYDWSYINSYEFNLDETKRLVSLKLLGGNYSQDYLSANVFAMTAITTANLNKNGYNETFKSELDAIGSIDELTYNSKNLAHISNIVEMMEECEEKGIELDEADLAEANALLEKWSLIQGDINMSVVPYSADIEKTGNSVSVSVKAKSIPESISGVAFVAIYNAANGKLLTVDMMDKSFNSTTATDIQTTIDVSDYSDVEEFMVQCFVWDALLSLKPLMSPVSKSLQ